MKNGQLPQSCLTCGAVVRRLARWLLISLDLNQIARAVVTAPAWDTCKLTNLYAQLNSTLSHYLKPL